MHKIGSFFVYEEGHLIFVCFWKIILCRRLNILYLILVEVFGFYRYVVSETRKFLRKECNEFDMEFAWVSSKLKTYRSFSLLIFHTPSTS